MLDKELHNRCLRHCTRALYIYAVDIWAEINFKALEIAQSLSARRAMVNGSTPLTGNLGAR
jgi:hypothetical protein